MLQLVLIPKMVQFIWWHLFQMVEFWKWMVKAIFCGALKKTVIILRLKELLRLILRRHWMHM